MSSLMLAFNLHVSTLLLLFLTYHLTLSVGVISLLTDRFILFLGKFPFFRTRHSLSYLSLKLSSHSIPLKALVLHYAQAGH